jgi:DNA invertase Pin-like site-specific DNA recombinase
VLKRLGEGDVLVVGRLDRLARSTRDLLNVLDTVAKASARFKSLGDPWADTTTPQRAAGDHVSGHRDLRAAPDQGAHRRGRKRAKERGVHMGRPSKLNRDQQREAIARREAGETLSDIARTFDVSHTTIGRIVEIPSR